MSTFNKFYKKITIQQSMHNPPPAPPSNHDIETQEPANNPVQKQRNLSDNPHRLNHSQLQQYDDIYQQPKVMRNSNSHYDTLLDQLYQERNNANDTKSYTKGKNTRQIKNEIHYFKVPERQHEYVVYCVANKESTTGIVSHERLIVLDTGKKELKYYSQVPKLPIKHLEDLAEQAKESIKICEVNNFSLKVGKKGIGQLQFSWVDNAELKMWKLKMASNTMAKEFATLVETVRSGKKVQSKSLEKSRVRGLSMSPQQKILNTSQVSSRLKKSTVQPSPKNSHFANMLLTSIRQPEQIQINKQIPSQIKKKEEKPSHTLAQSSVKQINYKIQGEKPQQTKDEDVKQKPKLKIEQVDSQKGSKKQIAMYSPTFPVNLQQKKKEFKQQIVKQSTFQSPKLLKEPHELNYLSVSDNLKNSKSRQQSINIDEILRVASIQRIQYLNTKPEIKKAKAIISPSHEGDRLSKLEQLVQKKKEESMRASSKKLIEQGMDLSKIMVNKNIQRKSSHEFKIDTTFNPSRAEEKSTINPKTSNSKYQTPKHASNRDHLLDQRKYAQTISMNRNNLNKAKVINQHSHPRRERGKSNSFSSEIDEYVSQQRTSKEWLVRWLSAADELKRGSVYYKFIEKCKQKVESLSMNVQNWHLFHKAGEQYIIKSEDIEFIYCVQSPNIRTKGGWDELELKMKNYQYLWSCMNEIQYESGQTKIAIPLACIITYKCLKVFCKVDLQASKIKYNQLDDLSQHQHIVNKLAQKTKSLIKNASVYEVVLDKRQFLYIEEAEARPYIGALEVYLNENYMRNYVQGVISSEQHFEQIVTHIEGKLLKEMIAKMQKGQYLSCIQLEEQLHKNGFDSSILPLLYNKTSSKEYKKLNRLVLSSLVSQLLASQVITIYHQILLSKNQTKCIPQQIHRLISKVLRLENDSICQSLLAKHRISINLRQLKEQIIEEYVICSMLIKLGIRCNVKNKGRLESLQKRAAYFWRQFEFSQSSVEFYFEKNVATYSAQHFNPHFEFLQEHIFHCQAKNNNINIDIISLKLNTPLGSKFYESESFRLLTRYQKQRISSIVSQQDIPLQANQSLWPQQQNTPFFHLFQFTTSYYLTFDSFLNMVAGIKYFIARKQFKKAEQLISQQLYRAWIWAKSLFVLLMESYDLLSLVAVFQGKEVVALESCLLSLQIAIKAYEDRQIGSEVVLEKAYKAATIHSKYGKTVRAIELFTTCQKALGNIIQTSVGQSLLKSYLPLYLQKSEQYLKLGELKSTEEGLRSSMHKFSLLKEKYHNNGNHTLSLIFQEEFEGYSLLFRVYELSGKKIEMLQLIEDCAVKYIESYLEHLSKKKQDGADYEINDQLRRYFREIMKNVWIAIVGNCNQWRVSTYQHYFNYSYAPLKNIELAMIRNIVLDIRKAAKGAYPLQLEQAINYCFKLVITNLKKYSKKQHAKIKPKSILVAALIDCLSLLTEHGRLSTSKAQSKSEELMLLESIVVSCGYEYVIGAIDSNINNFNSQL